MTTGTRHADAATAGPPGRRGIRSLLAGVLITATLGAVAALGAATGAANAGPLDGCTRTSGAVVAVDFGDWGGDVVRGCDPDPTTGYDLLRTAGFTLEGTAKDGPAFICRIGHPDFASGTQYPTSEQDRCLQTPPGTAYWSYWIAPLGQDHWSYSQYGAMSRVSKAGDVEAWVFGATDPDGGPMGQPSFTPDDIRPEGGEPTPTEPTQGPGDADAAKGAAWLIERLTDGDHVHDPDWGTTDFNRTVNTALALAATRQHGPEITRILSYLKANVGTYVQPNGPGTQPDSRALSNLLLLSAVTGTDPGEFGDADLPELINGNLCREADGDTCNAPGDFAGASWTQFQAAAILGLARTGHAPPAAVVDRLLQLQCPDGAFSTSLAPVGTPCGADPGGTTAMAAMALRVIGGHDDAVAKAVAAVEKAQFADGGVASYEGAMYGDTSSTAHAWQVLGGPGESGAAEKAMGYLARMQNDDGGFGSDRDVPDSDPYATAYATVAAAGASFDVLLFDPTAPTTPPTTTPPTSAPPTSTPPTPPTSGTPTSEPPMSASPTSPPTTARPSSTTSSTSDGSSPTAAATATSEAASGGPDEETPTNRRGGILARTGTDAAGILLVSAGLLVVGSVGLVLLRRRDTHRA